MVDSAVRCDYLDLLESLVELRRPSCHRAQKQEMMSSQSSAKKVENSNLSTEYF